jgi:hypothetical protein
MGGLEQLYESGLQRSVSNEGQGNGCLRVLQAVSRIEKRHKEGGKRLITKVSQRSNRLGTDSRARILQSLLKHGERSGEPQDAEHFYGDRPDILFRPCRTVDKGRKRLLPADTPEGIQAPDLGAEVPLFQSLQYFGKAPHPLEAFQRLGGSRSHFFTGIGQQGRQRFPPFLGRIKWFHIGSDSSKMKVFRNNYFFLPPQ